jgi:hypothetical protein
MSRDTAAQREAIVRAAQEAGIEPSVALAIAERESRFDPRARSSSTIRGMYQMRGDHRARYGVGDSDDPTAQTKGWAAFFKDVKREMGSALGRDPTDSEGYLGHHFGGVRAGRMMKMAPDTPVDQVFTPREMAENPHFARAGTVGALNSTILADIQKRQAKFGGQLPEVGLVDFAKFGEPVESNLPISSESSQPVDFAASSKGPNLNMGSAPAASSAPDFSNFGVAVS